MTQMKYITKNGKIYFHQDSIAELLIELGSSEEKDVQNRLNIMANNIRLANNTHTNPSTRTK